MKQISTVVYYWEDGSVASYGFSKGKPHRRVFASSLDDKPHKTDLVSLLKHLAVNDSVRFVAGGWRDKESVFKPATKKLFMNWIKVRKPNEFIAAL